MEDIIVDYVLLKITSVNLKTEHKLSKMKNTEILKKKKSESQEPGGTKPSNLRHIIRITIPGRSTGVKRKNIEESCACMLSHFSHVRLFETLWTVAHQVPLSMGLSRQEHQSGLPHPSPGDLSHLGTELESLNLPH